MKKTLAIVLALVMVLCMIPAMSATTTETIADKSYAVYAYDANDATTPIASSNGAAVNSLTVNYKYTTIKPIATGKWSNDTRMAVIAMTGFAFNKADVQSITVNGKPLTVDTYAGYEWVCGAYANGQINFPVELTKAGYSETYYITVVSKAGDKVTTETAKLTLKLVNNESYKDNKTATVTNIATANNVKASTYIVGSTIYVDFAEAMAATSFKVTFADENGKAFSDITYAYNPGVKKPDGTYAANPALISLNKYNGAHAEYRLDKSATVYDLVKDADGATIKFGLETAVANYETKAYSIKMRGNVKEEDPKGIYFAETTKTIAMGETYSPVVMGVKTGKPVAATLIVPDDTDMQVIDLNADKNTVIGTREGVAYITAKYKTNMGTGTEYTSSSMKIVVTLPGESIPPVDPAPVTYYVTCRNLNVRKGAGTSYAKAGMIHRGDAVKVVEIKNGWAKLADGTYVCAKYIAK